MKYTIILLLFGFSLFGFCQKNINNKNDLEKDGLKGKVKQVNVYSNKTFTTKGASSASKTYDDKGYLVKSSSGYALALTDTFIYDAKGNLVEKKEYLKNVTSLQYTKPVNLYRKFIYAYDEKSNRTEEVFYQYKNNFYKDSTIIKSTYKYDGEGNIIEKNINDSNIVQTYKYDYKGNLLENYLYKPKNKLKLKRIFVYDTNGNQQELSVFTSSGKVKNKITYLYDDNGNKIEQKNHKPKNWLSQERIVKQTYKYDDKGNIIEKAIYKADGSLKDKYIYLYEYDKEGNWVKKATTVNHPTSLLVDKLNTITNREIVYY